MLPTCVAVIAVVPVTALIFPITLVSVSAASTVIVAATVPLIVNVPAVTAVASPAWSSVAAAFTVCPIAVVDCAADDVANCSTDTWKVPTAASLSTAARTTDLSPVAVRDTTAVRAFSADRLVSPLTRVSSVAIRPRRSATAVRRLSCCAI